MPGGLVGAHTPRTRRAHSLRLGMRGAHPRWPGAPPAIGHGHGETHLGVCEPSPQTRGRLVPGPPGLDEGACRIPLRRRW